MVVVVTGCFVVMGDGLHRAAIAATTVPIIRPNVCVVGMGVQACPYDVVGCVPSSDDIGLRGYVSLLLDAVGSIPVIAVV